MCCKPRTREKVKYKEAEEDKRLKAVHREKDKCRKKKEGD